MKKYNSLTHILGLACACLILIGCGTTQPGAATAPPPNSARLLVNRVANFGSGLSLVLSVDGKDVGSLTEGRNYSGYLSAGQHVITAQVNPNQTGAAPVRKTLVNSACYLRNFHSSSALQLTSLCELMQRREHRLAGNPDQATKGLI